MTIQPVTVWRTFSSRGKSELAVLVGKLRSAKYVLPFAQKKHGVENTHEQVNAATHRSREAIDSLNQIDISLLALPVCYLDLSPIKYVWAMLSRAVNSDGKQCKNASELRSAVLHT